MSMGPVFVSRRRWLGLAGACVAAVGVQGVARAQPAQTLRVGFQKGGGLLNVLKAQGTLERTLSGRGWKVTWHEFPAGPQMLEALNAGSIDLGWTGAPPPIFAQAGGVELVYVGAEPEAPHIEAVIVKPGSSIRTVADLKGKRIAFQKGSSSHFLLVAVLEHAGLRITDVQPVFLPPADARAAFETDRVDAWTVWDPYLAAAQDVLQARVIADYTEVLHPSTFYESSRRFALAQPDILGAVLAELARTGAWANGHRRELAELLAPAVGLPVAVVEKWQARNPYGVRPVDDRIAATQQKVADTFFEQKIIPRRIAVQDYVWTWKPQV